MHDVVQQRRDKGAPLGCPNVPPSVHLDHDNVYQPLVYKGLAVFAEPWRNVIMHHTNRILMIDLHVLLLIIRWYGAYTLMRRTSANLAENP